MLIGVFFALMATIVPYFVSPKSTGKYRSVTYESGMPTIGPSWIQFNVLYYFYALVFLVFDVEAVFLFPVALAYKNIDGFLVLFEVVIFVLILSLALIYAIRKGVFKWR